MGENTNNEILVCDNAENKNRRRIALIPNGFDILQSNDFIT